jgi:hypothetical protein
MKRTVPYLIGSLLTVSCLWVFGQRPSGIQATSSQAFKQPISEIVVSDTNGLVFRSESGKQLAKIGNDEFGTYFNIFNSSGKPIVKMSSIQDKGTVIIGTNDGGYLYLTALEKGANISLINRYGKQVVEVSSGDEGGGRITLGEPTQGYKTIELDSIHGRNQPRAAIRIYENGQTAWSTP